MPGIRKFTKTFTVWGAILASSYSFGWNQVSDWLLCVSRRVVKQETADTSLPQKQGKGENWR